MKEFAIITAAGSETMAKYADRGEMVVFIPHGSEEAFSSIVLNNNDGKKPTYVLRNEAMAICAEVEATGQVCTIDIQRRNLDKAALAKVIASCIEDDMFNTKYLTKKRYMSSEERKAAEEAAMEKAAEVYALTLEARCKKTAITTTETTKVAATTEPATPIAEEPPIYMDESGQFMFFM